MYRRYIASLLLLGMVASQLASVPHAHGAADGATHSARSHVHLAWFCGDHAHPEHDGSHGAAPGRSMHHQAEHDSDAVYLATGPAPVRPSADQLQGAAVAPLTAHPIAIAGCLAIGERPTWSWCESRLRLRAPDCALYLSLRALRI